jgi:hypothetical protein
MDKSTKQGLAAWLVCVGILFGVIAYGSGAMSITPPSGPGATNNSSRYVASQDNTAAAPSFELGGHSGSGFYWDTGSGLPTFSSGGTARWQYGSGAIIPFTNGGLSLGLSGTRWSTVFSGLFTSGVSAGNNGFACENNGCRFDLGAGTNDYFDSDGTNITAHTTVISSAGSGVNALTMNDLAKLAWSATTIQGNGTQLFLNSNGATMITLDRATPLATTVAGSALSTVNIAGTIFSSVASTGNGGTCASGVDLIAYTLPANTLTVTNRCIRIKAWGITANNATAKNIDLALGAGPTILVTKALNISLANETWDVSATICRSGSSAQTSWAEAFNNAGTTVSSVDGATVLKNTSASTPNFTESSSQSIRVRCITNANAANDIVEKGMTVEYL